MLRVMRGTRAMEDVGRIEGHGGHWGCGEYRGMPRTWGTWGALGM